MYSESVIAAAKELKIHDASVLVTGATGLIGSCAIDVMCAANKEQCANIHIYALGRSNEKIRKRFGNNVIPIVQDIVETLSGNRSFDYILHGASNADPRSYARQPVETITTNLIGTRNILDCCVRNNRTRAIFTSSFEVYGKIPNTDIYTETMSGTIDQTILRNGYPESKRCCELLLRSYVEEYGVNAIIARLPSVYGPTMQKSDSKAHAQFIRNALNHENIIMKSKGSQQRSYCYVIDIVRGLFFLLENGQAGEIYNVANSASVASIAEYAATCAQIAGTEVAYELPDDVEAKGFSKPQNCILDTQKIESLGWFGKYSLITGITETIETLRGKIDA